MLTGLLLALARPIAAVMSTPAEAVPGTVAYLRICFLGVPLITAYNIIASVFRGLGDSKRPMYFIAIACAVNIALDYLFMGALHMGPAGAALGTTLAQAVSVACRSRSCAARAAALPSRGVIFARSGRSWGAFCASACRSRCRTD